MKSKPKSDYAMPTYGRLHNALQDHFGRIEESGRVMRKLSLYFPVMNGDILDELKLSNAESIN